MAAALSPWMALLLLAVHAAATTAARPASFGGIQGLHRTRRIRIAHSSSHPQQSIHDQLRRFRGGASADDSEYDDSEYDSEYDEEESDDDEEVIVAAAKKLAASTRAVAQKKKAAAIKSKVKVAMAASSTKVVASNKGRRSGSLYKRYVPYIVRACLNPFTLIAMTKAYFVSLCDINYLKEEQSQTLRSALEEKARKQQPPSGPPKRKMKPGQAKTLSDLPQLSA